MWKIGHFFAKKHKSKQKMSEYANFLNKYEISINKLFVIISISKGDMRTQVVHSAQKPHTIFIQEGEWI